MINSWIRRLENWIEKMDGKIMEVMVNRSIIGSYKKSNEESIKVMVDNSVIQQFTRDHWYNPVRRQKVSWPDNVPREMPILDIFNVVFDRGTLSDEVVESMTYVPSLIYIAKKGGMVWFTSDVLEAEKLSHPVGVYKGMLWCRDSIFSSVKRDNLDGYEAYCHCDDALEWKDGQIHYKLEWFEKHPTFNGVIGSMDKDPFGSCPNAKEKLHEWLEEKRKEIVEFERIIKTIWSGKGQEKKNIKDAWHIYTANKYGMDYLLTTDLNLIKDIDKKEDSKLVKSLTVKVISPKDLGKKLGVDPMSESLFNHLYKNTVL